MKLTIKAAVERLERTPEVLNHMLQNLSPEWAFANEGEGTWSAYDIVVISFTERKRIG